MIRHEAFVQACENLGLDSTLVGENVFAKNHPLGTYEKPFNLKEIGFPEEELKEVVEIGKIIYNLRSQLKTQRFYNLSSEKGRFERKRDEKIRSLLPSLEEAIIFWLKSGLKKSKEPRNLVFHNGMVFEMSLEYKDFMNKMNEDQRYANLIIK